VLELPVLKVNTTIMMLLLLYLTVGIVLQVTTVLTLQQINSLKLLNALQETIAMEFLVMLLLTLLKPVQKVITALKDLQHPYLVIMDLIAQLLG
jgi:hypothetical protein